MRYQIVILLFCVCLVGSNGLILSPIIPAISHDLETDITAISRAIAGYGLGTAASAFMLGRYLERLGYLRVLASAMAIAGLSQLISAYSEGWITLTAAQTLAGMTTGVALPSIYALTAEIAPKGKEAKTLGIVVFGWSLALVAAIPLATFLAYHVGWRTMLSGIGLAFLCMTCLLKCFRGAAPPKPGLSMCHPLTPLTFPGAINIYTVCGLFMAGFYGTYAFSGAHAVEGFSMTIAQAGYIGLSYGAGFGLGSAFGGKVDKFGAKQMLPLCLFVGGLLLGMSAFAAEYWQYLLCFGLIGIANSLIVNMIVMRVGALNAKAKGAALGLYTTISYVGVAGGTLLFGVLYSASGFTSVALIAGTFYTVAGILSVNR